MCNKRFDSTVVQIHAEQCNGPDSNNSSQSNEVISARYRTRETKTTGRRGRGRSGRGSYQPSLKCLLNKEQEEVGIDSSTTDEDDQDLQTSERTAAGRKHGSQSHERDSVDVDLDWSEGETSGQSTK